MCSVRSLQSSERAIPVRLYYCDGHNRISMGVTEGHKKAVRFPKKVKWERRTLWVKRVTCTNVWCESAWNVLALTDVGTVREGDRSM